VAGNLAGTTAAPPEMTLRNHVKQRPDSFNGPKMSQVVHPGAKELYPMPQKSKHHTKNRLLITVLKDRFLRWENAIRFQGVNEAGSES